MCQVSRRSNYAFVFIEMFAKYAKRYQKKRDGVKPEWGQGWGPREVKPGWGQGMKSVKVDTRDKEMKSYS